MLETQIPILEITNAIPRYTKDESLKLEGSLMEGDSLFINNELISLVNNKFEKTIYLVEGKNNFDIIAADIAGNRMSKSISITKDSTPPKLLEHQIIRDSKNKNEYFLKITASDITGLKKSAVVTINVDGVDRDIILKLTNNSSYSKKIFLNEEPTTAFIKNILLEDYMGNSKRYEVN